MIILFAYGDRYGLTVRLLPLRLTSEKVTLALTDHVMKDVVYIEQKRDPQQLVVPGTETILKECAFKMEARPYQRRPNNEIEPRFMHPDFQRLADDGIGICWRIGLFEYCDHCNLYGRERIKFPKSEIIPVVYEVKKRAGKSRRRSPREQTRLKFK